MKLTNKIELVQNWLDCYNKMVYELAFWILLPVIARLVLGWAIISAPQQLQSIVTTVFFGVMFYAIWLIATDNKRKKWFGLLHAYGFKWPFFYSISVLFLSISCFASLFYLLYENGFVNIIPTNQVNEVNFPMLQDFFLWHFLKTIPIFEVPDTILFNNPYTYKDSLSGWLLLTFKVVVITPIIATFAIYFKLRKQIKEKKSSL